MCPERRTKTTVLIVGEGLKDQAFLCHLKEICVPRESEYKVKVECGSGGSPRSIIEKAIRLRDNYAYDKCVVVIDEDRPLSRDKELNKRIKEKPPIEIIWVNPCMEGLLLEVLAHPHFSRHNNSVHICKREFATYIPIEKQTEKIAYARTFPRDMLDLRRSNIPELNRILKSMGVY